MGVDLGSAFGKIVLDASGAKSGVGEATGALGTLERAAGGLAGTVGGLLAGALTAAPFIAFGKAAWDAGNQIDDAYDTIQIGTGKTGEALVGLQESLDAVFTSIPTDAGQAAEVIGALNSRLGVTGEDLEGLSINILEASRLLGGDATTNAELFSRVMGDWSIPVEQGNQALDKMFTVSQQTGVGLDGLMQKVVQFGAPMRLMGFTFEDSISLFGKWEKEGVNAELVMGSLRIAAGTFAAEGKPLRESLLATFDSIKNNTDASAALAEAMDVFGARAGPDMAAAIREGRFDITALAEAMANSEGAILETADATNGWAEKLDVLKNKIGVALAPAGGMLMDLAGTLLDKATPAVEGLTDAFGGLMGVIQGEESAGSFVERVFGPDGLAVFEDVQAAVGPFLTTLQNVFDQLARAPEFASFGNLFATFEDGSSFLSGLFESMGMSEEMAAPLAESINNIVNAFAESMPMIQTYIDDALGFLQQTFGTVMPTVVENVTTALNTIADFWREHGDTIMAVVNFVFRTIVVVVGGAMQLASGVIAAVLTIIDGIFDKWSLIFQGKWKEAFESSADFEKKMLDIAKQTLEGFLNTVLSLVGMDLAEFKAIWSEAWNSLKLIVSTALTMVRNAIEEKIEEIKTAGRNMMDGLRSAIEEKVEDIVSAATGLVDDVKAAIENKVEEFASIGQALIDGLAGGIQAKIDEVVGWIGEQIARLPEAVKALLGIETPNQVFAVFSQTGEMSMLGLAEGLLANAGLPERALERLTADLAEFAPVMVPVGAGSSWGGGGGSSRTSNIQQTNNFENQGDAEIFRQRFWDDFLRKV